MIYLKDPKSQNITEFDNINQVGTFFKNWEKLSEKEIAEFKLQKAKEEKITELLNYYDSNENWIFTVYSKTLNASLSKDADWFGKMLSAVYSNTIVMVTESGVAKQFHFQSDEQKRGLHEIIVIQNSYKILLKKLELVNKIKSLVSIEDISDINIANELQNCVERTISIDDLK